MKQYYVYIMANYSQTVIYTGITNNLIRRVFEHKNKLVKGFTEKYNITKLVFYETYEDPLTAINREKYIKNLLRSKKFELIKQKNPNLIDLYDKII